MRPVSFPVATTYEDEDWVVTFASTREELRPLGEPGFIEEDSLRTAGGREFHWAFELESGLRFSLRWSEEMKYSVVVADPPDPSAVVAALRALGMNTEFVTRELPEDRHLRRRMARGCVWLFTGEGAVQVTAVFSRKALADAWLAEKHLSGELVAYPLDTSVYEAERRWGIPEVPQLGPEGIQCFVGRVAERYTYRDGNPVNPGVPSP
ncbi:DUF7710 domain-containing protein [Corallococcus exiguus]|uniref:DUF7710 domain-containing protein n=1 Tax=Corallococcus exiguus TaxID=83462 RepID=A0A7X4YCB4_9BACT|nr:hypothetical protein [Corallococcus exiguus]NBC42833.1 hypothetical protein [Corallococcus exiguus]TNV66527.1 hypothetical protein FH620_05645 [Corallococcus exiguus]